MKKLGQHCRIHFDYQLLYNCINILKIILQQIWGSVFKMLLVKKGISVRKAWHVFDVNEPTIHSHLVGLG